MTLTKADIAQEIAGDHGFMKGERLFFFWIASNSPKGSVCEDQK